MYILLSAKRRACFAEVGIGVSGRCDSPEKITESCTESVGRGEDWHQKNEALSLHSGESHRPLTPILMRKYRDTPPVSIAILLQKYALFLVENLISRTNIFPAPGKSPARQSQAKTNAMPAEMKNQAPLFLVICLGNKLFTNVFALC